MEQNKIPTLGTKDFNDAARAYFSGEPKKEQTAIEWLQWAFEHTVLTHEQIMQTIGLFDQAKQMEKEHLEKAFNVGCDCGVDIGQNHDYHEGQNQGYEYYEQNYGKANQPI